MDAWPFRDEDWEAVEDAVVALVNASGEEADELIAAKLKNVFDLLEALAIKYGPHPILYETKADILPNPAERVELYRQAIRLAESNALQTLTIRLSLAEVLIKDLEDFTAARKELAACKSELTDEDLDEWNALAEQANR
ncbi:MAG: hypothetical protein AB1Z51_11050 [Desulfuromonadales bacterium]